MERAILNVLRQAVGRGGEVSVSTWDDMFWDDTNHCLFADWREVKTGHENPMMYVCDADSWLLDVYHSWACMLISNSGVFFSQKQNPEATNDNWMFPAFSDMADGGASKKATRIFRSILGEVNGLLTVHTSHGIRVGATDDMAFNITTSIVDAIYRGGWDFTGDCTMFTYMTKKLHNLRGGKALAGWRDCAQDVSAPSCECFITKVRHDVLCFNFLFIFNFVTLSNMWIVNFITG